MNVGLHIWCVCSEIPHFHVYSWWESIVVAPGISTYYMALGRLCFHGCMHRGHTFRISYLVNTAMCSRCMQMMMFVPCIGPQDNPSQLIATSKELTHDRDSEAVVHT